MYTVDFVGMYAFQMCHDPDCRAAGFRGQNAHLPFDLRNLIQEILFEMELGMLGDEPGSEDSAAVGKGEDHSGKEETAPPLMAQRDLVDDEDEFERALMALDISGKNTTARTHGLEKSDVAERCVDRTTAPTLSACPTLTAASDDDDWDKALAQAMLNDPDLFP